MAFIIIEGVDRNWKSSLADLYRSQGYKVVHMSAPDKKYYQEGYAGPSYCDELLSLLISLSGQDVVLDRSWYGESVWAYVYNRKNLLSEEDLEILREIEDQNDPQRILMCDPEAKANWQRCVDNNEPLDIQQFTTARAMFLQMADKHGFSIRSKSDYANNPEYTEKTIERNMDINPQQTNGSVPVNSDEIAVMPIPRIPADLEILSPEQKRLAEANAINDILCKPIIRLKGDNYTAIEQKLRVFLKSELAVLLGTSQNQLVENNLTQEEVLVIRNLISRSKK